MQKRITPPPKGGGVTLQDIFFMKKALTLARRGLGKTHPNPMVGAVVVKNGRILGSGAHEKFGGPHAEVSAIRNAGGAAGATLYVTLEPCPHTGKTPPCTDLILREGIKKVVIAALDPNPLVSGRGISALRKNGVEISAGVMEAQARELNKDYNHWVQKKMPYVTLKFAQSLDGKIAHPSGRARWISSLPSRRLVHQIRASADAILIGIETLLADDPLLSIRLKDRRGRQPTKIILDSALRTPLKSKIFSKASPGPVMIATCAKAPVAQAKRLMKKAEILKLPDNKGRVNLLALFKILGRRGIVSVLIEGGVEVIKDVLSKKLAHEVYCFVSPKVIGPRGVPGPIAAEGIRGIQRALKIKRPTVKKVGRDFLIRGTF